MAVGSIDWADNDEEIDEAEEGEEEEERREWVRGEEEEGCGRVAAWQRAEEVKGVMQISARALAERKHTNKERRMRGKVSFFFRRCLKRGALEWSSTISRKKDGRKDRKGTHKREGNNGDISRWEE